MSTKVLPPAPPGEALPSRIFIPLFVVLGEEPVLHLLHMVSV